MTGRDGGRWLGLGHCWLDEKASICSGASTSQKRLTATSANRGADQPQFCGSPFQSNETEPKGTAAAQMQRQNLNRGYMPCLPTTTPKSPSGSAVTI
ncbi:hypothetical protein Landi51_11357 [Colletotrichum acutatum]